MIRDQLERLGAGEQRRKAYADMLLAQAVQRALYPDAEDAERQARPLKLPAPKNRAERRSAEKRRKRKRQQK